MLTGKESKTTKYTETKVNELKKWREFEKNNEKIQQRESITVPLKY